jgi:exonuclease III
MAKPSSVFTWNVNKRAELMDKQADRVVLDRPDVVCLQEVTPNALSRWTARLKAAGYFVAPSAMPPGTPNGHKIDVLIASRFPLTHVEQPTGLPWPHRSLVIEVELPEWSQALRVFCLHAPNVEDPNRAKVLTLEAIYASLCGLANHVPAILCGDLNTPQSEARDGTIQTFARTPKGKLKARLGARHDDAERMILSGPPGWRDAFRTLHGFEALDRSWKAPNGTGLGFRLDHILLSPNLTAVACAYDHGVREQRLSDHSAMYATIALSSDRLTTA